MFGLNIFIHIFIHIVIYKYTVYNTIVMGFRKKSNEFPILCFPISYHILCKFIIDALHTNDDFSIIMSAQCGPPP